MLKPMIAAAALSLTLAGTAAAQQAMREPPQNAKKLSEIIAKVEQRPDFRYIGEVDWDDGGYEVTYYTTDNAKVEIKFDPVSGETKSLQ
ncbi:MAG: PepSY domain-containing protein [Mesorhizobium sp.]|jgi:hypothetical protein